METSYSSAGANTSQVMRLAKINYTNKA